MRIVRKSAETIEVRSSDKDGFPVGLQCDGDGVTVMGGAWHEYFSYPEEALECVAFLLSDACSLKTVYRGSSVVSCTVQSIEDGAWVDDTLVGFFLFRFWKPKRVEYLQNTVITDKS